MRKDLVDEIKEKTTKWKPREAHHNSLREIPAEHLHSRLGTLDKMHATSPNVLTEVLSYIGKVADPILAFFN